MSNLNPTLQKDVYKEYHVRAYHPQVSKVYTNYTSRSGKLSNVKGNEEVCFVGLQYFIKSYLQKEWQEGFFDLPKELAIKNHKRVLSSMLGYQVDVTYLADLHDLGYLPLIIKALPEGSMVPYQVAPVTLENTVEGFQWLPNMIETVMSTESWGIQTSATTSVAYMRNFKKYFDQVGLSSELLPFMGHDFSFRGMFGKQAAAMSGFGHLCSGFAGTDTIPAVLFAEEYYNADCEQELVGCSVDATEHSVTCSWLEEGEKEFFKFLMEEQTPTGILSVVSDTWDFWTLVTEYLPEMKEVIMNRDGKLVIRPDSGDPVDILCGKSSNFKKVGDWFKGDTLEQWKEAVAEEMDVMFCENLDAEDPHCSETYTWTSDFGTFEVTYEPDLNRHDKTYYYVDNWGPAVSKCTFVEVEITPEDKGLVECLWETFGGTTTEKGFKVLDEHIGAIYGDSITLERQVQICERLIAKGFAPTVVLGIGSYTYQYVTRDTHGSAVKATNVVKNGIDIPIFKDPKTDSTKKSAKGLLRVEYEGGKYVMYDNQTREQEQQGCLETIFLDGHLVKETSLAEIRQRVQNSL